MTFEVKKKILQIDRTHNVAILIRFVEIIFNQKKVKNLIDRKGFRYKQRKIEKNLDTERERLKRIFIDTERER